MLMEYGPVPSRVNWYSFRTLDRVIRYNEATSLSKYAQYTLSYSVIRWTCLRVICRYGIPEDDVAQKFEVEEDAEVGGVFVSSLRGGRAKHWLLCLRLNKASVADPFEMSNT